jgi:hypothetical protein
VNLLRQTVRCKLSMTSLLTCLEAESGISIPAMMLINSSTQLSPLMLPCSRVSKGVQWRDPATRFEVVPFAGRGRNNAPDGSLIRNMQSQKSTQTCSKTFSDSLHRMKFPPNMKVALRSSCLERIRLTSISTSRLNVHVPHTDREPG